MAKRKNFNETVFDIVKQIPKGYVLCYGDIANLAGVPAASRAVGYACAALNAPEGLPFHRVVYKDGALSRAFMTNGKNRQYAMLKAEGVTFGKERKVNMAKHRLRSKTLDFAAFLLDG
jgi:methylated-DNA-protein-cysteine methyltransferase-like protein